MKKYIRLMVPAFSILLLMNACSNEEETTKDKFSTENNFEEISYWTEIPSVIKSSARSGHYCTFTDESHPYTATLKLPYAELKKLNAQKITASAWLKSDQRYPSSKLVISVEANGKNFYWNGSDSTMVSSQTSEWREIKIEGIIPAETPESATIIFYGWNTGKDFVLWDDFKLTAN